MCTTEASLTTQHIWSALVRQSMDGRPCNHAWQQYVANVPFTRLHQRGRVTWPAQQRLRAAS